LENENRRIYELQTLKTIAETLNKVNDLEEMLHAVLKELIHVTGLECGWIFLVDKKGAYSLVADYELPPALTRENKKPMCEGGCWCLDRYKDGRLARAVNIIECKRLEDAITKNWGETKGITHHATVPLRAGDERFGILNIASPNKTHFTNEELALLEAVALQIGTAIKRIKLVENEQRHLLMEERNRIARDLHDSVNQLLFSVALTARGAKEVVTDEATKETLDYIQQLAREALQEMRSLIWQLRPQGLENGVASALMNYGKMLGLDVEMEIQGVIDLPNAVEECLWRVGQEALNNCKKHAGVSSVAIRITVRNDKVTMEVTDEGNGFAYEGEEVPSLGLKSMKERIEALKGTLIITSVIGEGTTVKANIPFGREWRE